MAGDSMKLPRDPEEAARTIADRAAETFRRVLAQESPPMTEPHAPDFAELRAILSNVVDEASLWVQDKDIGYDNLRAFRLMLMTRLVPAVAALSALKTELAAEGAGREQDAQRIEDWRQNAHREFNLANQLKATNATLTARVGELEAERDGWKSALEHHRLAAGIWQRRAAAAEAQVAVLREALEAFVYGVSDDIGFTDAQRIWSDENVTFGDLRRARAALDQKAGSDVKEVG